eukprot:m.195540 g.195540  ORF g.195540 m.195540 type:complete len:137 (+) comp17004_c0_seq9:901-1311(+)
MKRTVAISNSKRLCSGARLDNNSLKNDSVKPPRSFSSYRVYFHCLFVLNSLCNVYKPLARKRKASGWQRLAFKLKPSLTRSLRQESFLSSSSLILDEFHQLNSLLTALQHCHQLSVHVWVMLSQEVQCIEKDLVLV